MDRYSDTQRISKAKPGLEWTSSGLKAWGKYMLISSFRLLERILFKSFYWFLHFLKLIFIFNWRIIALQCCVGFCYTVTGISQFVQSLSCAWLCKSMDWSRPGFLILHHLPGLAKTHVHWVSDDIQLSHPLLSPSSPAFNLFQHQGIFQ